MIVYKCLRQDGVGRYSGFRWPRPAPHRAGHWVEVEGPLHLATNGIHACRIEQLPWWLDSELWEFELGEPVQHAEHSLLGRRGRLLRPIDAWNEAAAHAFMQACAEGSWTHAANALRRHGKQDRADALATGGPDPLAATAAAEDLPAPLTEVLLATADVAFASGARMSACLVAFLAARVARGAAAAVDEDALDAELSERRRQARWLAERLGLPLG